VPTAAATTDATTELQIRALSGYVLKLEDLPAGFVTRSSQGAPKGPSIEAQAGVPKLATYLQGSDLVGTWGALFTSDGPPQRAVNSIIFLFASPGAAAGFVEANRQLQVADYASATDALELPSPDVGDSTVLMRFVLSGVHTLELTWSQGPLAGQIILRSEGEDEASDDREFVGSLAQTQAGRMVAFLP
jgi:hypothetical protein